MTSPISGSPPVGPPTGGTTSSPTAALRSDDFLKLLVAQLKYQDPTSPTDATAFLSQTAQLTQVDTLNSIAATQGQLLASTLSARASGLVGHTVDYLSETGDRLRGTVTSATFGTAPTLRIGDRDVPLSSVFGQPANT